MPRLRTAALTLLAATTLAACGGNDPEAAGEGMTAPLVDANGTGKGTVTIAFDDKAATVTVKATGLAPGLHGFHVHKTGVCEPDSADPAKPETKGAFLSAEGHLAKEGQSHGDHDGDLPSLLVQEDGSAELVATSDRLTRADVLDDDGSAIMIHEMPDNFGNVPDRYTPTLDDTTKKTGDAGSRVACAVLEG
ncbi:MAG: superoxide dismutase family protein [Actinobacteria bacterium]|nr:superoxide dismutase family protein [Actinomycetota bacterium]